MTNLSSTDCYVPLNKSQAPNSLTEMLLAESLTHVELVTNTHQIKIIKEKAIAATEDAVLIIAIVSLKQDMLQEMKAMDNNDNVTPYHLMP